MQQPQISKEVRKAFHGFPGIDRSSCRNEDSEEMKGAFITWPIYIGVNSQEYATSCCNGACFHVNQEDENINNGRNFGVQIDCVGRVEDLLLPRNCAGAES
ncbi:uncharacterized protein CIMG_03398 [Coccidioides immitis RS]|uniref:Uncharacterized protein n=4 Tax=Coccidioides immitis TaxID=5501 RepID=J3KB95_COCIM|nr:uncharacterized protein CIMG_03398 [Coccidioides immitis RS]EAS32374.3 hypothetical protein CIMG_03398 [Coccidioides immitis RS]KMP07608.1 hypothetical protein CIRG_07289 [Coccidioides immitis RMSCC 2394]KMU71941.1 hypothetical protein CISG_00250 [Coccidioides immitis RMSCC 3703]KMU82693.1 hypothetical protein CIHG_00474 [Coccidioides immitis H538.4]